MNLRYLFLITTLVTACVLPSLSLTGEFLSATADVLIAEGLQRDVDG